MQVCVSRDPADHRLKIIDLGLARLVESGSQTVPVTVCGTPEFISPEVRDTSGDSEIYDNVQVLRCTEAGPASDAWSAGVVVFMLLTGF